MSDPSFRAISPPQSTSASTETEQAAFEPDHLARNHRQQELSTPPAHSSAESVDEKDVTPLCTQKNNVNTDGAAADSETVVPVEATAATVISEKVVSTTSIAENAAVADFEGTVSETDSTGGDTVESATKDAVDYTIVVKPTTDATDAVGQSNIVANDNDSTAPIKSTAAIGGTLTESVPATADGTAPVASYRSGVDTKDAVPLSIVEVTTKTAVAIDTTASSNATASSKKTHIATKSTVFVDTASSSSSEIKEENVTHVSVTEGASVSEKPTIRQKSKKIELKTRQNGRKIKPTEEEDITKAPKEDLETTTTSNVLKVKEEVTPAKDDESLKEKEAVQELEIAQEPEVAQEIRNTCSYMDLKEGFQCVSRVLTVKKGPFFCQKHHRYGHHGEFVFSNQHISILLKDDFEALAERYPDSKQSELCDLIQGHFEEMFEREDIMKKSIGGLNKTIIDMRTFAWVKRGFLYVMDYIQDPEEDAKTLALKIGSTTGGGRFRDYYKYCNVRGKDSSGKFCHPVAIFPPGNNPAEKEAREVLPFVWLFEKIIHCIYEEFNAPFRCQNETCHVKSHKEVYTLHFRYKSRRRTLKSYRVEILENMEVWSPFLEALGDDESLVYAFQNTLYPYSSP